MWIEIDATSENAAQFAQMQISVPSVGRKVQLSELTDAITTAASWSGHAPPSGQRPEWIDEPASRSGDVWRQVVSTGEYSTAQECRQKADQMLSAATWLHLQNLLGRAFAVAERPALLGGDDTESSDALLRYWPGSQYELQRMGIGINFIRRQFVPSGSDGEYLETVERQIGPMKRLFTLVEFTAQDDAELKNRWTSYQQGFRTEVVSSVAALVLAGIGLLYGLLKIDTWTKGYYSKRLLLGVPAAIIAAIGLVLIFVGA